MLRLPQRLLGRWNSRDFLRGRSKCAGAVHTRHTHGSKGRYKRLSSLYGLRDGRRHSGNRLGAGLGVKLGGGLFGLRIPRQHALSTMSQADYELEVYGHPNITNPYRHCLHEHPTLDLVRANPGVGLHVVLLLPRVSRARADPHPVIPPSWRAVTERLWQSLYSLHPSPAHSRSQGDEEVEEEDKCHASRHAASRRTSRPPSSLPSPSAGVVHPTRINESHTLTLTGSSGTDTHGCGLRLRLHRRPAEDGVRKERWVFVYLTTLDWTQKVRVRVEPPSACSSSALPAELQHRLARLYAQHSAGRAVRAEEVRHSGDGQLHDRRIVSPGAASDESLLWRPVHSIPFFAVPNTAPADAVAHADTVTCLDARDTEAPPQASGCATTPSRAAAGEAGVRDCLRWLRRCHSRALCICQRLDTSETATVASSESSVTRPRVEGAKGCSMGKMNDTPSSRTRRHTMLEARVDGGDRHVESADSNRKKKDEKEDVLASPRRSTRGRAHRAVERLVRWHMLRDDPRAHASDTVAHDARELPVVLLLDASGVTTEGEGAGSLLPVALSRVGAGQRAMPTTMNNDDAVCGAVRARARSLLSDRFAVELTRMGFQTVPTTSLQQTMQELWFWHGMGEPAAPLVRGQEPCMREEPTRVEASRPCVHG